MRHGKLTREQLVDLVGEANVDILEHTNCEPTSRLQTDGDTDTEFCADLTCKDLNGDEVIITAWYYQSEEEMEKDSYDDMDWEIHAYSLIYR